MGAEPSVFIPKGRGVDIRLALGQVGDPNQLEFGEVVSGRRSGHLTQPGGQRRIDRTQTPQSPEDLP